MASSWTPDPPAAAKPRPCMPCYQSINNPNINIITIEDPIEYQITGHQPDPGQSENRADLRPGAAAPSCARIPDVILVGESPGSGDGGHCGPVRPDRPPGVLHPPHQRFGQRDHPPGGHGGGAVFDLFFGFGGGQRSGWCGCLCDNCKIAL